MPENNNSQYGQELLKWKVHEYPDHDRSWVWYLAAGTVGVALILYAVFTSNFLFALIILMIGVISLMAGFRKPDLIDVAVTTNGILIGDNFYGYSSIKDFSVVYKPPEVKYLYIDFNSMWRPMVSLPLGDTDPNKVREELLPFAVENLEREEEDVSDVFTRLYKF